MDLTAVLAGIAGGVLVWASLKNKHPLAAIKLALSGGDPNAAPPFTAVTDTPPGAAPGGPTGAYMRRGTMNAADLAALEEKLGLNDPLPVQYGKWLSRVLQGDLGMAVTSKRPVAEEILGIINEKGVSI